MLKLITNVSAVILFSVFASSNIYSAENLTSESKEKVVAEVSEILMDQYIFPDVGEAMAQDLLTRLENGAYDDVVDVDDFAIQLTDEMQKLSNDQHLFIFYSDTPVSTEEESLNPSPELELENTKMHEYLNSGVRNVRRLDGNIGYFDFSGFMDSEMTAPVLGYAMNFLQNTGGLIIDLRANFGGMPKTVPLLASYFLGPDSVHVDSIYWRKTNETQEYWTTTELEGAWYGTDRPVMILTSSETFSAAEAFSYAMKAFERAEIVGEATRGGAHPGGIQRVADNFYMFVSHGRAINSITGENWEGTGVTPNHPVVADEALVLAHKLILRAVIDQTDFILDKQDREMHLQRLEELE